VQRLWLAQAAALAAFALSVVWAWIRARRARSEVARLVVDLARAPAPGGLEDALRSIVGDPDLELAYPLADRNVWSMRLGDRSCWLRIESEPASCATAARSRSSPTPRGCWRDEQLVEEVTNAARLALENERLQAEVRAHLEELRASRARIVEAGDAERRRLERDLHDGAQQRLVALSLWLRLVRSQRPAEADPSQAARFDEADAELRAAIGELRELAHGIFPAVLADEGLAAAVEALAEQARVPLRIDALPEGRLDHAVETTAYTVVAEAARAATSALAVRAARSGPVLVVEVETVDLTGLDVAGLEDRVGALDGSLAVERRGNGRVTIRAVLPCAS
jgi:signal transduction histidine kinase